MEAQDNPGGSMSKLSQGAKDMAGSTATEKKIEPDSMVSLQGQIRKLYHDLKTANNQLSLVRQQKTMANDELKVVDNKYEKKIKGLEKDVENLTKQAQKDSQLAKKVQGGDDEQGKQVTALITKNERYMKELDELQTEIRAIHCISKGIHPDKVDKQPEKYKEHPHKWYKESLEKWIADHAKLQGRYKALEKHVEDRKKIDTMELNASITRYRVVALMRVLDAIFETAGADKLDPITCIARNQHLRDDVQGLRDCMVKVIDLVLMEASDRVAGGPTVEINSIFRDEMTRFPAFDRCERLRQVLIPGFGAPAQQVSATTTPSSGAPIGETTKVNAKGIVVQPSDSQSNKMPISKKAKKAKKKTKSANAATVKPTASSSSSTPVANDATQGSGPKKSLAKSINETNPPKLGPAKMNGSATKDVDATSKALQDENQALKTSKVTGKQPKITHVDASKILSQAQYPVTETSSEEHRLIPCYTEEDMRKIQDKVARLEARLLRKVDDNLMARIKISALQEKHCGDYPKPCTHITSTKINLQSNNCDRVDCERYRLYIREAREREEYMEKYIEVLSPMFLAGQAVRLQFLEEARAALAGEKPDENIVREGLKAARAANGDLDNLLLTEARNADDHFTYQAFQDVYKAKSHEDWEALPELLQKTLNCQATIRFAKNLPAVDGMRLLLNAHENLCDRLIKRFYKYVYGKTALYEANSNHWVLINQLEWLTDEILMFDGENSVKKYEEFMEKENKKPKVTVKRYPGAERTWRKRNLETESAAE
ncbi:uncharacterized protein RCO7_08071 [Rhynchosporium graminicola]|uniref:Uncharacterized protein n=1 Tax=Rhynchosporium graminicola TaxID=2792576 RepID=A0A1E1K748_9HELO|nr:uncharacterized protein RCO7_08071 [Rhynchosporium commune]